MVHSEEASELQANQLRVKTKVVTPVPLSTPEHWQAPGVRLGLPAQLSPPRARLQLNSWSSRGRPAVAWLLEAGSLPQVASVQVHAHPTSIEIPAFPATSTVKSKSRLRGKNQQPGSHHKQPQTRQEQTQPSEPPAMFAEGRKGSRSLMHGQAQEKRVEGSPPQNPLFLDEGRKLSRGREKCYLCSDPGSTSGEERVAGCVREL